MVLPRNGPKFNVHASKELGCEGKTQINCASGKGLTKSKRVQGVSWTAPWFVLSVGLWALVSVRVRLMAACNVTTVTKPRAISWGIFPGF